MINIDKLQGVIKTGASKSQKRKDTDELYERNRRAILAKRRGKEAGGAIAMATGLPAAWMLFKDHEKIDDLVNKVPQKIKVAGGTKDVFSPYIEKLKKIPKEMNHADFDPDLINSFIKKHKLIDKGVHINVGSPKAKTFMQWITGVGGGKLSDYYNPIPKSVNLRTKSTAVALHELGHAADFGRFPLLKNMLYRGPAAIAATSIPIASIYGDKLKTKIKGDIDDKAIEFVQRNPGLTALGAYASATLIPEGMATAKAMTHVVKEKGGAAAMKMMKKSLGPAYLTYLAGAAPIALAASYVGKAMKEYSDEKAMKSKKKKKKPMIKKAGIDPDIAMKAGKAFMYGAVPTTVIGAAVYNSPKFKKFLRLEQEVLKKRITKTDDEDFKDNLKGKIMGNRYLEQNPNKAAIAQGIAAGILTSIIYSEYPLLKGLKKKVYLR